MLRSDTQTLATLGHRTTEAARKASVWRVAVGRDKCREREAALPDRGRGLGNSSGNPGTGEGPWVTDVPWNLCCAAEPPTDLR